MGDDEESRKGVVVRQSNDLLYGGEGLLETSVQGSGVIITRFVECDECGGCGDLHGCRGELGGMRGCESGGTEGMPVSCSLV